MTTPVLLSLLMLPFQINVLSPMAKPVVQPVVKTLAEHAFSLENRYPVPSVSDVFKDNILLTIDYATGTKVTSSVDWNAVEAPFKKTITIEPGQTFAFHDDVLPEFAGTVSATTNAHFSSDEGFKSDGYLVGDGVCHLASLMYWVAKDAGLTVVAPTRHDFAVIPEVPREYGTAIYTTGGKSSGSEAQNLYIKNNKDKAVVFEFDYDGKNLSIKAEETN